MGASSASRLGRADVLIACVGASLLVGCPLDERTLRQEHIYYLQPGNGDFAGAGGQDLDNGGAAGEGAGGTSDAGTSAVVNGTFDEDLTGWDAEDGVDQSWTDEDVVGSGRSGSLDIVNSLSRDGNDFWMAGTSQCVPVTGGHRYRVGMDLFIPSGQSAGGGGFDLELFNAPDCQGVLLGLTNFLTATTDTWESVDKAFNATAGTKSALLRLVVTKVLHDPGFEVRFDDVAVREQ